MAEWTLSATASRSESASLRYRWWVSTMWWARAGGACSSGCGLHRPGRRRGRHDINPSRDRPRHTPRPGRGRRGNSSRARAGRGRRAAAGCSPLFARAGLHVGHDWSVGSGAFRRAATRLPPSPRAYGRNSQGLGLLETRVLWPYDGTRRTACSQAWGHLTELGDDQRLRRQVDRTLRRGVPPPAAGHRVGRIGVVVGGAPGILSVNDAIDGERVVFRTDEGLKLRHGTLRRVAFEIDGFDEAAGTGWSVLVQGSTCTRRKPVKSY